MNPELIDGMSWEMAEVYGAITDQILINLAKYFPYYDSASQVPKSAFTYQASMLAQMGQVNRETIQIIRNGLKDADSALNGALEQAIIDSVRKAEKPLWKAAKQGIFMPPQTPVLAPNQYRAFQLYYKQAAQKLNLVNTVMLESTQQAYRNTVSDIALRVQEIQKALDIGAGETITGVSSWNQAVKHSIARMTENGITGFIDHGGHRWSAEAYTAMDIRTTVANTARAAVWETNQNFGNDLYLVSYHSGARPLCYDWQNKVISSMNAARDVVDLDGNTIHVYAQSETTYGQPAGLFGINCKHYPTPFIPGVSLIRGEPQDKEENAKTYAESQQQRSLERKIREEKRDLMMMKAQGAPDEMIKAQRAKIRQTDDDIDAFCAETGRARRQNREGVYTKRDFPDAHTYDVTQFTNEQKERIKQYYQAGGEQQGFKFGQMTPNVPIVPNPPAPPVVPPATPVAPIPQNVASQATTPQYTEDMFNNAKGMDQQFEKGMARTLLQSGNDDAINLYGKYADDLNCVNANYKRGAHYSSMQKGVSMNAAEVAAGSNYEAPFQVAFHEFGHMIDDLATPGKPYYLSNTEINGKRLVDVIKDDWKAFKKSIGAKTNDDAIIFLKAEGLSDKARANVSDALEKCTNRSYPLGFGHGVSYHRRDGATEKEFFAETLDSAIACPESYAQMKRIFPNAVDFVWTLIKGVI